jgi:hypothetical protein
MSARRVALPRVYRVACFVCHGRPGPCESSTRPPSPTSRKRLFHKTRPHGITSHFYRSVRGGGPPPAEFRAGKAGLLEKSFVVGPASCQNTLAARRWWKVDCRFPLAGGQGCREPPTPGTIARFDHALALQAAARYLSVSSAPVTKGVTPRASNTTALSRSRSRETSDGRTPIFQSLTTSATESQRLCAVVLIERAADARCGRPAGLGWLVPGRHYLTVDGEHQ